jgi:hypothetical protein
MRTPEELDSLFLEQLQSVYARPQCYADPSCIETTLWCFHRAWALVHRREAEFQSLYLRLYREPKTTNGLYSRFRDEHPSGSHPEAYSYILGHWASVTKQLGVPVELDRSFAPGGNAPSESEGRQ